MSSLYNFIEEILNEPSTKKAKERLFGINGLDLNSTEYYENIISSFVRKKDLILQKSNSKINYNLNKDVKDMWDIIFISQYIYKCWKEEQSFLQRELSRLRELPSRTSEENEKIRELTSNISLINDYFQKLNKRSEISKVEIIGLDDTTTLETEISELKKAVLVFQKLRDSFEHRNENLSLGDNISINNEKNYFSVTIPCEYINGFNKGRIIAREEDQDIVTKTNDITYPLLKEMNYDIIKIESFFYNIDTAYLEFLLSKVDNDINKLYQLPVFIFNRDYREYINSLEEENIRLEELSKYNEYTLYSLFFYRRSIKDFANVVNYCKNHDLDATKIISLTFFEHSASTIALLKIGVTPEQLNYVSERGLEDLDYLAIDLQQIKQLEKLGLNFTTAIPLYRECKEELLELYSLGFDFGQINNETKKLIKESNCKINKIPIPTKDSIDYMKSKGIDIKKLSGAVITCIDYVIKLLEEGEQLDLINSLSIVALINLEKAKELIASGIDFEIINNLNYEAFEDFEETKKYLVAIRKKNRKYIEPLAITYPIRYKRYYEQPTNVIETIDSEDIKALLESTLLHALPKDESEKLPRLISYLKENGIKIADVLQDEYYFTLYCLEHIILFVEYCKKNNLDKNITKYIPLRVFDRNQAILNMDTLKHHPETNIETEKQKSDKYNEEIINIIELIQSKGGPITKKLPEKMFYSLFENGKINYSNIDILLTRVNGSYERLNEFPVEFFTCDTTLLNELLMRYNTNISKSIFGIDNPKIVATLIYMNSVLSSINSNNDFKDTEFDIIKFIHGCYNDTIRYTKTTTNNKIQPNQETYLGQMVLDDKTGDPREVEEIKTYIIKKLRNSCAHFRFKIVKDENNQIIEDKVYLYDEYNDGRNNFNIIISINTLINIIRSIELSMEKEKTETTSRKR